MTPLRSLPRAVLFDWDNTLADNWGAIHAALNVTLVAMDHQPWTLAETRARVRRSMRESFPALFGDRWETAREIFYQHFRTHHLDHLRAMPGADDLIRMLAERGVYQAVVSNKSGAFLRIEASALGWQDCFGRLVGAADASADKPALAPVTMALEPLAIEPGSQEMRQVWFVGDADIDMECAHAAGCVPVLIGPDQGDEHDRFPPAVRLDSCVALYDLVRELCDAISISASNVRS